MVECFGGDVYGNGIGSTKTRSVVVAGSDMRFLGLDLGSSSIKGGVLDLDSGEVQAVHSAPFPSPVEGLRPGCFEVELPEVMTSARDVMDGLLAACPDAVGVLFSSQMGGVVLTDDRYRAVSRYLSWRDQRVLQPLPGSGRTCYAELLEAVSSDDLSRVGQELKPGGASCLLYWLARSGLLPDVAARAMSLGDYVVSQLTGASPRSEPTLALGLVNLETGVWHRDWFESLGFGQLNWPELATCFQPAGEWRVSGRLVPCFPAVGDHQAALFGTGLKEGELSINVSTGAQVSELSARWQPGNYQTRPYFDGRLLNTITHLPAGRSLNGLVDLLTEIPRRAGLSIADPWEAIAQAVDCVPDSSLDVHLAFFASSVGERGHIQNVVLENLNVGSLFRAAFRNMADNFQSAARRLDDGETWTGIVLSGGLPRKLPALAAEISSRFKAPVRAVHAQEETLQGLLELARIIAGSRAVAD